MIFIALHPVARYLSINIKIQTRDWNATGPFGAAMGAIYDSNNHHHHHHFHILITVALVRSRRALHVNLECLKAKTIEQPAIYEELDYVHMMSPKPAASSPTIDTGQNTDYLSFSGLLHK